MALEIQAVCKHLRGGHATNRTAQGWKAWLEKPMPAHLEKKNKGSQCVLPGYLLRDFSSQASPHLHWSGKSNGSPQNSESPLGHWLLQTPQTSFLASAVQNFWPGLS